MDRKRIAAAMILMLTLGLGLGGVLWGERENRLVGTGSSSQRGEFAEALQDRFDSLTPEQHRETCQAVRVEGLVASVAFIRERHYILGPRMPFYDDIAERILTEECLIRIV